MFAFGPTLPPSFQTRGIKALNSMMKVVSLLILLSTAERENAFRGGERALTDY